MKRSIISGALLALTLLAAEGLHTGGLKVYGAEAQESPSDRVSVLSDEGKTGAGPQESGSVYDGVVYRAVSDEEADMVSVDAAYEVETADGVTQEMCYADYWYDKNTASRLSVNEELITTEEIEKLNREMTEAEGTYMNDLEALNSSYDADALRKSLAAGTTTTKEVIYADGEAVDPAAYYGAIADAIEATGYTGKSRDNQYAIAVKRTTVLNIPVDAYIGYSKTDSDDEKVNSALNVGEPFVIRQKATVLGSDYYWGYCDNCTGWVAARDIAICSGKDEWLEAFKIDPSKEDFIVVTQNQIRLEPSISVPELSEIKLTFATILKTVPEDKIPESMGERGPWNNHVVYLPVRDENGSYVRCIGLISQHYEVSTGFLKLTQAQLLRVAFNSLGDRYGWGGMLDSMDCSLYTRNVYRCFGISIPRNTSWQQMIPGRRISLEEKSAQEKLEIIQRLPAGTLLYFPGHTMIYTGTDVCNGQKMGYVISDTGTLSDSTGELKVRSMYSVILNPLSVRRRAGTTWLENTTAAVLPVSDSCFAFVEANIASKGSGDPGSVTRVPASEGQTFASSEDTLPLETFTADKQKLYISFAAVDASGAGFLSATVLKGSRITTRAAVKAVRCDKKTASYRIDPSNGLATVTLKGPGTVIFEMADGRTREVAFSVESIKPRKALVKGLIKEAASAGKDSLVLDIKQLFGTKLDGGVLEIKGQKGSGASVLGTSLIIDPSQKQRIKLCYRYLNEEYKMTIKTM
ncbi:MAG TPA: hypothetical protein DCL38_09235 [Lachnospiraceae bacterium]|nr:hypothetical protein [Lachnospiraceae bacterium]